MTEFIVDWTTRSGKSKTETHSDESSARAKFARVVGSRARDAQLSRIGDDEDGSQDAVLDSYPPPVDDEDSEGDYCNV